ncbi:DUF1129 family protein [Sporolactobacillus laevolacticus]|uniref:DUF1129 domain-containing protein n=1 Tax=Sporolactobacillus laevolacticus DSM 442 TaxID=1395513 RepID=V6J0D3_9BACL|nr:DUF1129 family protein [Sporolactobacillus laevolacticus]EST12621.1 hypothetical protein P343_05640 [Sporolactobacillus laevolacticus DSM 442]
MISSKQLISENNEKRKLLNKENEKYYGDLLLYIRLQMRLSEQQSEELLMELLDHLIEGQSEGKTAQQIFGDNPKKYADEIISELPNERPGHIFSFIAYLAFNLISWLLIIRGAVTFVFSFFKHVDETVYIVKSGLSTILFIVSIGAIIWYLFFLVRKTLFNERSSKRKDAIKAGWLVQDFSLSIF